MINIEFICSDELVLKTHPVLPAKKVLPEWFKKLPTESRIQIAGDTIPTIKQCMPAMDMMVSGYIIVNPYKIHLYPRDEPGNYIDYNAMSHVDYMPDSHQYKMCPVRVNEQKKHWVKIKQPWIVKTPPGYSCLFIQPFYQFKHDWRLFPAIVDTDKHDVAVHFPGYADHNNEVIIDEGEPLMQVIQFKREEWQMSTSFDNSTSSELDSDKSYQNTFHSKKKFI